MRAWVVPAVMVIGCTHATPVVPRAPQPEAPQAPAQLGEKDQVRLLVIQHLASSRGQPTFYCVQLEDGADPGAELLARLRAQAGHVYPASACSPDGEAGASAEQGYVAAGETGSSFMVTIKGPLSLSKRSAEVEAGYGSPERACGWASFWLYRDEQGQWSLDDSRLLSVCPR